MHFSNPPVQVSARVETGFEALLQRLTACLPPPSGAGGGGVDFQTASTIQRACDALREAFEYDWEGGLELVAMELREAGEAIGRLSSRVTDEDILDAIFARFCIGK
jgi:tRNA modification GTPase